MGAVAADHPSGAVIGNGSHDSQNLFHRHDRNPCQMYEKGELLKNPMKGLKRSPFLF
jgi:hypothetical protein